MHPENDLVNRYDEIRLACDKLQESVSTIYQLALPHSALQELADSDDEVHQIIGMSPAMAIASYVFSIKDSLDFLSIFDHYEFNEESYKVDESLKSHGFIGNDIDITNEHVKVIDKDQNPTNQVDDTHHDEIDTYEPVNSKNDARASNQRDAKPQNMQNVSRNTQSLKQNNSKDDSGFGNSNAGNRNGNSSKNMNGNFNNNIYQPNNGVYRNNNNRGSNDNNYRGSNMDFKKALNSGKTKFLDPALDANAGPDRGNINMKSTFDKNNSKNRNNNDRFVNDRKGNQTNIQTHNKIHNTGNDNVNGIPMKKLRLDKNNILQTIYVNLSQNNLCPEYITREENGLFHSVCRIKSSGEIIGEGKAKTKKDAQRNAAENALINAELL